MQIESVRRSSSTSLWRYAALSAVLCASRAHVAHADTLTQATARVKAASAQFVKPFFSELDCENVGYVQPDEVDEHAGTIFLGFDVNRSQSLDPREWNSYPFMSDKPLLALSFKQADTDGSGQLSFQEFTSYLKAAVRDMDRDGDGEIYPADLETYLPARK